MTGPLELGDEAISYVREEIAAASDDFDGPLARRLVDLGLGSPFSLLPLRSNLRARDFRRGGVDGGRADRCLAAAISRWLAQGPEGTARLLLLEEPLARRSDPAVADAAFYAEDRVYFASSSGDDPSRVEFVLGQPTGYPGIGVLSECPEGFASGADLTEQLDLLASAASAVLVRAWDDEGFIVVPVDDRLASRDLWC